VVTLSIVEGDNNIKKPSATNEFLGRIANAILEAAAL
jgi:hypothetical protein